MNILISLISDLITDNLKLLASVLSTYSSKYYTNVNGLELNIYVGSIIIHVPVLFVELLLF